MAIKDIATGRTDVYKVDPRALHLKPDWNSRDVDNPENIAHIDQLAQSIAEVGVKQPLTVYWEDGKAWVTDGWCRLHAVFRAIEYYKADIKTVPVINEDRFGNEVDRVFTQIVRNQGKPFSAMEQAKVYRKLCDLGWNQSDIAKKSGVSQGRISQVLELLTLPEEIKRMIACGQVSSTFAMQTFKANDNNGEKTIKQLTNAFEGAKSEGKTKLAPKHMEPAGPTVKAGEVVVVTGTKQKAASSTTIIKGAFERATIDNSDDEVVVVAFNANDFEMLRQLLGL